MMKIKALLYSLLLFAVLTSCKKQESESKNLSAIETNSRINRDLVTQVAKLPKTTIGLGFAKLSSDEKVYFANQHIDNYLKTHEVSEELRNHILKLKVFLTPEIYSTLGQKETDEKVKNFTKNWFEIPTQRGDFPAKILFEVSSLQGAAQAEASLNTLNNTTYSTTENQYACNCIYDLGCEGTGVYCYSGTSWPCTNVGYNCGILGTSNCTGRCF